MHAYTKRTPCLPRRRRGGHTLLEIMIVAVLIGTAGIFAVSNLRHQMPTYQLDRATTQLVNDLNSARMRAISEALPARVAIDADARTYSIWVDANTNGAEEVEERDDRVLSDVPGLSMKATASTLTFSPRGRLPTVNNYWITKLTIGKTGPHYIYVLPSGQVCATRKNLDWETEDSGG